MTRAAARIGDEHMAMENIVTSTQLARARWQRTATFDRYLVAQAHDGGNVLATVVSQDRIYTWTAGGKTGQADTIDKAMRAARRALREAQEGRSETQGAPEGIRKAP